MNDEDTTFTINLDDDITINLNSISSNTGTYSTSSTLDLSDITTYSTDSITLGNTGDITFDSVYTGIDKYIDPDEVEEMCREYPALSKVWRNFKSVYDMVQQDYEGKKKAGEIDDEIPF